MLGKLFSQRIPVVFSMFFVLALVICWAREARAQVSGARLSGIVTDTSGAVIPGVMVSIKNRATGIVRNLTTDEAGFYFTTHCGDRSITMVTSFQFRVKYSSSP